MLANNHKHYDQSKYQTDLNIFLTQNNQKIDLLRFVEIPKKIGRIFIDKNFREIFFKSHELKLILKDKLSIFFPV